MKYVAFIGSRDLSQFSAGQLTLYKSTVLACVQHGYAIVTGAAVGADQLAAETAFKAAGKVLLVLPWADYESEWVKTAQLMWSGIATEVYDPAHHRRWTESVHQYHPAAANLKRGAFALHARNFGIVGRASAVVALPSYEKSGGGTAQGMRVAAGLGIKAFDLRDPQQCVELEQRLIKAPSAPAQPRAGVENSSA